MSTNEGIQPRWTNEDQELLDELLEQKQQAPFIRFTEQLGRPTKLNDELIERFIACLESHAYIDVACAFCGIHRDTFYKWMNRASEYADEVEKICDKQQKAQEMNAVYKLSPRERSLINETKRPDIERLIYFFYRVREAQAKAEILLQRHIINAAKTSWVAAAWLLERKFPERWLQKDVRQLPIGDGSESRAGFAYIEVPPDPNEKLINQAIDITPEKKVDTNPRSTVRPFKRAFGKKLIIAKKRT